MMKKNVAGQKWTVFAFNRTTNLPVAGDAANITANLRIDGGGTNPVDDTNPTVLEGGYYVFDITQAESNGDLLAIAPSSTTSNVQVIGVPGAIYTTTPGASVTVSPIQMTVQGRFATTLITLFQYEAPLVDMIFTDDDDNPIDLSGVVLALVVYPIEETPTEAWRWTSTDAELIVSGDDNNQLQLTADDTNTQEGGRWKYMLWDTTNGYPKAHGILAIERSAGPTAP